MKKIFKALQSDNVAWLSFWITGIIFVFACIAIAFFYHTLPPVIPLYNHMPWGYSRLGKTYEIFFPIGIAILLSIANMSIGVRLRDRNPLLARFLFVSCIALSLFTIIFLTRLLQVVL